MGLLDRIFGPIPDVPSADNYKAEYERSTPSEVAQLVNDAIAARQSATTMTAALALPAVQRGVNIITSIGASFTPVVYRNNVPMPDQPRITKRPNPYLTRYDFVSQTLYGLVVDGSIIWIVTARDRFDWPTAVMAVPKDKIVLPDNYNTYTPTIEYNGKYYKPDDYRVVAINRRAGEFWGRSPLREGLDYLAPVIAAEDYATGFFASGGLPEIVLKAQAALTADEAAALKAQFLASRTGTPEPVVMSGGVEPSFPAIDPQRSQMQEARAYGATVVARLLGIPAPLLHVETSGATVTYANAQAAVSELTKATIAPMYLNPIEQTWSDLVPSTQSVRFDLAELERADISSRMSMYSTAIAAGVMTADEARALEGWSPTKQDTGKQFDPSPDVSDSEEPNE